MPVRLPMHPEKELHMVVVKGFGEEPAIIYQTLPGFEKFFNPVLC